MTANGGTLDASGAETLSFRGNGGTIATPGTGDRNLFLVGTNTGWNTLDLALTDPTSGGGSTSLQKFGTGTWRLLNTGNSYSGDTIIARGEPARLVRRRPPHRLRQGRRLPLERRHPQPQQRQSHHQRPLQRPAQRPPWQRHPGRLQLSRTLTVGNGNADGFYSGTLSGTGLALRKIGTGNQVLGGTNTFARGTSVEGGTLTVISDDALSTGSVTVGLNATLDLSDTALTDAVSDAATVSLFRTETASSLVDFGNGGLNDVIAALFVNGQNLGDGIYNAQTLPGLITGNGSFRVGNIIPEPTTATLLLSIGALLLRRPRSNA